MFKRKFKHVHNRISNQEIRWRDLDMRVSDLSRQVGYFFEQQSRMQVIKTDMQKMDVLTAMMSELARRVDLAGIADLPNECVCETCGCKK
jgi:hypothetical protein